MPQVYGKGNPQIFKFLAFGMLLVSAGLIVAGVYFYVDKDKQLEQYKLIKCKIIKIDEPIRGKAELTFKDVSGLYPPFIYVENYDASEDELDYKVNEIHEVYYHPKDPNRSEIKNLLENYETAFIFFMIALVFIIDFPVLLFVSALQKKKQSPENTYGFKESVISE